ncbi:hypothetical protein [Cryptosporidium parvum Iowa II]|uniref:Uncharacterized protein n=2 Tax=Cryptosporidium parvum TaxID=5807 RepID=Q5CVM1_CRYPI|nr:hypothetical protein [Cryptosporidium parvum Iowa II]EAK89517.1 hypothetical protein cgd8_3550 [Cryptosporidium parvum Iowa II]QOY40120.1 Uncharacterized protein CPATCC_0003760 [Cryptosporidium parvum]WKS79616.1 hypothetical protein CPCDC_8g3550 [Cryptosporidium sp. 43IA8]WRK34118.1 Uncharacterized protein cpbgf_8003550 [Cryptosporidium parvum]|eukprot:QOY40120.1 hypothetical protein CPATCC_004203 [Cryptosporidium parvum]
MIKFWFTLLKFMEKQGFVSNPDHSMKLILSGLKANSIVGFKKYIMLFLLLKVLSTLKYLQGVQLYIQFFFKKMTLNKNFPERNFLLELWQQQLDIMSLLKLK